MTEEDQKQIIGVAEQLERAVQKAEADRVRVDPTFSVAVWAAARLRHLAS